MSNKNRYLPEDAAVVEVPDTVESGALLLDGVNALIELIEYEGTDPDVQRLFLDEMSPACRVSLYACLQNIAAKPAV